MSPVSEKLFGQHLHPIRSKAARQKFLRKKLKKVSREQVREEAIDCILYILATDGMLDFIHQVTDFVLRNIADRVLNGDPEPDVDNFEDQYPQNQARPSSSAEGSPAPSPNQMIPVPRPSPDKPHFD